MNMVAKIACRTIGTVGMGMALCDAWRVSSHYAKIGGNAAQARYLSKAYYSSRTTDKVSYAQSAIAEKTFDVRTRNPLPLFFGRVKGRAAGFLYGLGNFLPAVACSALALTCKNWGAKLGALGVLAATCFNILRQGFGVGKKNPMN